MELYRNLLIAAVFSPSRSIPDGITELDLDAFGNEGRELHRIMSTYARETNMKVTQVTWERRVLMSKFLSHYGASELLGKYEPSLNPASLMHYNREDLPPDVDDLGVLFLDSRHPGSIPSIHIVTPDQQIIVFRGPHTPQYHPDRLREYTSMWKQNVERQRHLLSVLSPLEIERLVRLNLVSYLCREYDLRYFTGALEGNTVQLQSFN